jgi:acyl carrier protein
LHRRQAGKTGGRLDTWVTEWVPVDTGGPVLVTTPRPCVLIGDQSKHFDRLAGAIERCPALLRVPGLVSGSPLVLIHSRARSEETPDEAALRLALDVLKALQDLRSQKREAEVWVITHGVMDANDPVRLAGACIWGLGKTAALEIPDLWGGLADLPLEFSDADANSLLRAIMSPAKEDQLALRKGQWFASRLAAGKLPEPGIALRIRPDAVYWIPGGTGALGGHVLRALMDGGARHVVLSGRGENIPASVLKTSGSADVRFIRADVCNRADVALVLAEIDATGLPLAGIVHAAGTTTEHLIEDLTPRLFRDVAAAKVTGAWNLHELTQGRELDFFVCFSSIASLWGAAGQAHYAAANHFLDTLCQHRQRCGQPALAINWGPWSGGGMVTPEFKARLLRAGLDLIDPGDALELLNALLGSSISNIAAVRVRWEQFGSTFTARRPSPLLSSLILKSATPTPTPTETRHGQTLLGGWNSSNPESLRAQIRNHIRTTVAGYLGEGRFPDTGRGFFDMGLDSLAAVEIRNRLVADFGLPLSNADMFNYPTIDALTSHILDQIVPASRAPIPNLPHQTDDNLSQDELMARISLEFDALVKETN